MQYVHPGKPMTERVQHIQHLNPCYLRGERLVFGHVNQGLIEFDGIFQLRS